MKTAYIHLRDHQDPIWNKAFEQHFESMNGDILRSYSEREALQFDRWLDILPDHRATLQIEQSSTFRKYLQLNPERREQIKQLTASGKLSPIGGGEIIIDYNVIIGESIYRNFLHGLRWMESEMGKYPELAGADDTFGLSAQLPQILSQFGFKWLPLYARCFDCDTTFLEINLTADLPNRPYWRGLDGSLICIRMDFADEGVPYVRCFVNHQYRACPQCRGNGCRLCEYTGMDMHMNQREHNMAKCFAELRDSDYQEMRIGCLTEETVKHPNFFDDIIELGKQYDIDVRFDSHADMQQKLAGEYIRKIDAGEVSEDEIDQRAEANPIGTGCYTVRSVLKKENRQIEHLMLAAERFAVIASAYGYEYPAQSLATAWQTLCVTQAHDALTGNHPDGTYLEMLTFYRKLRRTAGKFLAESCRYIASQRPQAQNNTDGVELAVFNPLTWAVAQKQTELVIHQEDIKIPDRHEVTGWTLKSSGGSEVSLLDWSRVVMPPVEVYQLNCICRDLPACGYTTIFAEPVFTPVAETGSDSASGDDIEAAGIRDGMNAIEDPAEGGNILKPTDAKTLENSRYRLSWDDRGLTEIFDKSLGKVVAQKGSCDLIAEDDIGSFWDKLVRFEKRINLNDVADVSLKTYASDCGLIQKLVISGKLAEPLVWDLPDDWTSPIRLCGAGRTARHIQSDEVEVLIESLSWQLELTITEGDDKVDVKLTTDCDSQNIRLSLPFDFGFKTTDDKAVYEIPYGMLERKSYEPIAEIHLAPDGAWPAVHWAAAINDKENYTCAVLNRGIPSYKFNDGVMEVAVLRSPRIKVWSYRCMEENRASSPLSKDSGPKFFELALVSGSGNIEDNRLVHRGYEFNTEAMALVTSDAVTTKMRIHHGKSCDALGKVHSFLADSSDNVMITTIKRTEDGNDVIVRAAEIYGRDGKMDCSALGDQAIEVSPMERYLRAIDGELSFRPFEIKTIQCPVRIFE